MSGCVWYLQYIDVVIVVEMSFHAIDETLLLSKGT